MAGRTPRTPPVTAGESARPAIKRLLAEQYRRLRLHGAALAADDDDERLHDFRVALRRSRTLFGRCRDLFAPAEVARFHAPLRELARRSGVRRDLDLLLASLPPADADDGAAALRVWLVERRSAAQRDLLDALNGPAGLLLADWGRWLAEPPVPGRVRPLGPYACRCLKGALRALRREGATLAPQPSPPQLHRLRILGKRVRYLIEFFLPLLPAGEWERLLAQLKALQDLLGRYQDGISHLALLRPPARAAVVLHRGARCARRQLRRRQQELLPAVLAALSVIHQPWVGELERSLAVVGASLSPERSISGEVAMKQLTLIRHAKAKKADRRGSDRDRPLRRRGEQDARTLAALLPSLAWPAPLVLTSPARRARETAAMVFPAQPDAGRVVEALYPGNVDELLAVVQQLPDECQHVVLVGHHPALTGLWQRLTGEECDKLPTGCCYSLGVAVEGWDELLEGAVEVVLRHAPRHPAAAGSRAVALSPAPTAVPAKKPRSKRSCRKGVSEAAALPGNYRCRKCKAVSTTEERLCAPARIGTETQPDE